MQNVIFISFCLGLHDRCVSKCTVYFKQKSFFFPGWFVYTSIGGWSERTIMCELLCLYGKNNSQMHAHQNVFIPPSIHPVYSNFAQGEMNKPQWHWKIITQLYVRNRPSRQR